MMNLLFGPLSKDACLYFYVLMVFFGIMVLFVGVFGVYFIVKNYKKFNSHGALNIFILLINVFVIYFVNRLLYTMCYKSI